MGLELGGCARIPPTPRAVEEQDQGRGDTAWERDGRSQSLARPWGGNAAFIDTILMGWGPVPPQESRAAVTPRAESPSRPQPSTLQQSILPPKLGDAPVPQLQGELGTGLGAAASPSRG